MVLRQSQGDVGGAPNEDDTKKLSRLCSPRRQPPAPPHSDAVLSASDSDSTVAKMRVVDCLASSRARGPHLAGSGSATQPQPQPRTPPLLLEGQHLRGQLMLLIDLTRRRERELVQLYALQEKRRRNM